jgi:heterodisulfide reductase subunit B
MAEGIEADAIVVACPLCHQNLDLRQGQVNSYRGSNSQMPILYFTQVIGLALGYSPQEMGMDKHAVSCEGFLTKWEANLKERKEK